MKTKLVLFACAVLMSASLASADPTMLADFESGSPLANWGLGSWQGAEQTVIDGSGIGASTNWLQVGMGNDNGGSWNTNNNMIKPWWGDWGTFTLDNLNAHSAWAFDVIAFNGVYNSSTLYAKLGLDTPAEYGGANLYPSFNQDWHAESITLSDPDIVSHPVTITHVVIPYTDIFPTALANPYTDGGQCLQGYFQLNYAPDGSGTPDDGEQLVFIDNLQFVGNPLPVPEPATIAMLALAGLMGMLYSRKR